MASPDSGALPPSQPAPVVPLVLAGRFVRLEPLAPAHRPGLMEAGADARIWSWMPLPEGGLPAYLDAAFAAAQPDSHVPFVVTRAGDGRVIGMTRLFDIRPRDSGLEIGHTWYAPDVWAGPINAESKRLLLSHAFDVCGYERVQLKTDLRNTRSQAAIAKLGARREGVLRRNMRLNDGYLRSTVMFSILRDEWPAVCAGLTARLAAFGG